MSRFCFYDPGPLIDGDLSLELKEKYLGDPAKGYVPAYKFQMQRLPEKSVVGEIDLRIGASRDLVMYGGHLGYFVHSDCRGHHYALRACRLLLPLAQKHRLNPIWITCNPDNAPSRRTCELLGAELVEIVKLPEYLDMYKEGEREKCRYRLMLGELQY